MTQKADVVPVSKDMIHDIYCIAEKCFSDPWSESLFESAFEHPDSCFFGVQVNDTLAGYIVVQKMGDVMSVDDIAVLPDFRRLGIAKQLIEKAHEKFSGYDFILEVRESNLAAVSLYIKLGYKQVGYRKRYYSNPVEGALLMTRYNK